MSYDVRYFAPEVRRFGSITIGFRRRLDSIANPLTVAGELDASKLNARAPKSHARPRHKSPSR